MKVLLLNHSWLSEELTSLGHEVLSAGSQTKYLDVNVSAGELSFFELCKSLPTSFIPDCLVYYDDSGIPWLTDLESVTLPKIFYSVDTHHHHGWHKEFASLFDYVLLAQKTFLPLFSAQPAPVEWFPPWATREMSPAPVRDISVCFRGNLDPTLHPRRASFFAELSSLAEGDFASGDYLTAYPRAKIVVNQTVNADLNFRVFEALMSGALLITPDDSPGLADLFTDGEDLLTYSSGNAKSAAAQIERALSNDAERARIAAAGREKTLRFHTSKTRAQRLNDILRHIAVIAKPSQHLSAATSYLFARLVAEKQGLSRPGLLEAANTNLCKSLKVESATESEIAVTLTLHLSAKLHAIGEDKKCEELFALLFKKHPTSLVTKMGYLDALLANGNKSRALEIAETIGPNVELLLAEVPALMAQTRENFRNATGEGGKGSVNS